jgi:hypothetical protein
MHAGSLSRWFGLGSVLLIVVGGCADSEGSAARPAPVEGGAGRHDDSGSGGGGPSGKRDSGSGGGGLPGKRDSGSGGGGGLPGALDGGSGREGGTPPVSPVWDASGPSTIEAACDRLADAICKRSERCSLFNLRLNYGDVAACITRYASECRSEVAAPGTGTTVSSLNRCANHALGAECYDLDARVCYPQAGQRTEGEACLYASQCAGRQCVRSIAGALCGTCTTAPGLGEACTRTCDYGLECAEGTCVLQPLRGMACSAQLECAGSLRCIAPGICAPPLGPGEPCLSYQLYQCDLSQGLECNSDSKVCAEYERLAGPGEQCGAATASFPRTGCLAGAACPTSVNDAGLRTCVARIPEGQPCGSSAPAGGQCAPPTRCRNGVCTMPDAAECQ